MPTEQPTILATSMGFNRARDPWEPSPIFDYAFGLAGNPERPKVCFISTGTGDRRASIDAFYGGFAGSRVDASHLALFDQPNIREIEPHLRGQDLIWVDRGSVVNLLAVWRAHRLGEVLRRCWQDGVILGGESAGSLCWFSGGTTDSFGKVRAFADGLGFLPYSNAVHYDDRRELFQECVATGGLPAGYATEAGTGLHFAGTTLVTAVSDRPSANAYRVSNESGEITEEQLEIRRIRH
jgi:peptidase E